jgi:predicted nucleic-acid-binding protein
VFDIQNVVVNRPAVGAGLQLLETGGDFADGVIADDGRWRGGDIFVSFDRKFVRLLLDQGQQAQPLE